MKTTIELSDALAARAREVASEEGTTLEALVEEGLRRALADRESGAAFTLRDASVGGRGLRAEFRGADWARIRDALYDEDQGATE
jgi:hypothetical protein